MLQHVRLSRYQSQLLLLWAWRTVELHKLTCVGAMEGTNGRPTRPSSNAQASKRSARFSTLPAQGWGVGVTALERGCTWLPSTPLHPSSLLQNKNT